MGPNRKNRHHEWEEENPEPQTTEEKKTWYYCKHIGCNKRYSSHASRHAHSEKCNKLLGSPLKKANQVSGGFKCCYCSCQFNFNRLFTVIKNLVVMQHVF